MSGDGLLLRAFSEDQAAMLSGLKPARLRDWNRKGFFTPSFRNDPAPGSDSRLYTFKDVVCLRTLAVLVSEHDIGLPVLRETQRKLFEMDQSRWASETLYVLGKQVYFDPQDVEAFQSATSTQLVLHNIPLRRVQGEVEEAVVAMRGRDPNTIGKIDKVRGVRGSRPVISGTRIPVSVVQELLDDGHSVTDVTEFYPTLKADDVDAVIRFTGRESAA